MFLNVSKIPVLIKGLSGVDLFLFLFFFFFFGRRFRSGYVKYFSSHFWSLGS